MQQLYTKGFRYSGKSTQENFFYIFNNVELHTQSFQLILYKKRPFAVKLAIVSMETYQFL